MIIYSITNNITGKQYIGQTIQTLPDRLCRHQSKRSNSVIALAIRKYGRSSFTAKVIQECTTQEELNNAEIYWITRLNTLSPNGYNLKEGGARGKATAEARKNMSLAHIGKPVTEEHRQRTSNQFKGRVFSDEHLAKIAETRRNWTDEQRKEVSTNLTRAKQGDKNPSAKLNWQDVDTIRELRKKGLTLKELGSIFNVNMTNIHAIVTNRSWKPET